MDKLDLNNVEKCFAEKVYFDMISMGAESAVVLSPGQITDMCNSRLKNLTAVYHQTCNLKVDVINEKAVAFCYGTASNF